MGLGAVLQMNPELMDAGLCPPTAVCGTAGKRLQGLEIQ